MNGRDEKLADELEARFQAQLRAAVEEAYRKGNPHLAEALLGASSYMQRSREMVVASLRKLDIYTFTPQQYVTILEITTKQLATEAIAKIKLEEETRKASIWSRRAVRWGAVFGAFGAVVSLLSLGVSSGLAIWQRLHH